MSNKSVFNSKKCHSDNLNVMGEAWGCLSKCFNGLHFNVVWWENSTNFKIKIPWNSPWLTLLIEFIWSFCKTFLLLARKDQHFQIIFLFESICVDYKNLSQRLWLFHFETKIIRPSFLTFPTYNSGNIHKICTGSFLFLNLWIPALLTSLGANPI